MRFLIQLITNNLLQQTPSICLLTSRRHMGKKYLFNTPQQFCRYMSRHHINLNQNNVFFFTKFDSDTLAGLVRVVLELSDSGNSINSKIYVDHGAFLFWGVLRKILKSKVSDYSVYDYGSQGVVYGIAKVGQADQLINHNQAKFIRAKFTNQQLQSILKQPNNAKQRITKHNHNNPQQQYWVYEDEDVQIRTFKIQSTIPVSSPSSSASSASSSSPSSSASASSQFRKQQYYNHICLSNRQPINLDKQKLQQFQQKHNIKLKSKQISQLLSSGSLVIAGNVNLKLQDLVKNYQDKQMSGLAILHYRTVEHIQLILGNQCLNGYMNGDGDGKLPINYIVHIVQGDGHPLFTPQFSTLRQKFGSKATHIIHNKYCRYFDNTNSLINEMNYFYLHFKIMHNVQTYGFFPNFYTNLQKIYQKYIVERRKYDFKQLVEEKKEREGRVVFYRPLYHLVIAPLVKQGYQFFQPQWKDNSQQPIRQKRQQQLKVNHIDNVTIQKLKQRTSAIDPKIIFLGTSSSRSSRTRNVSGILQKYPSTPHSQQFSLLIDCGDGIHQQLINHFGALYEQQLLKIKILFMSHFHQDHCAGFFSLVSKRNRLIREKFKEEDRNKWRMFVVLPENMVQWMKVFCQYVEDIGQFVDIVTTQSMQPKKGLLSKQSVIDKSMQVQPQQNQQTKSIRQNESAKQAKQSKPTRKPLFSKQPQPPLYPTPTQSSPQNKISQMLSKFKTQQKFSSQCLPIQQLNLQQQQQNDSETKIKLGKYHKQNQIALLKFKQFLKDNQVVSFIAVPVIHCSQSYGLVVQHVSKNKIAFSGDCRPTSLFIKMAQNSTLVIHEATFVEGQESRAKLFNHSSAAQAIQIGYKSKSLYTILTHFTVSQSPNTKPFQKRIAQIHRMRPNIDHGYIKNNVILAYDHLQFKTSQLYKLPVLVNALERQKIY